MARLIDADALKESMIGACNIFEKHGIDTMIARAVISIIDGIAGVDAEPTVDAEPVRRGRWATEWISVNDRLPDVGKIVLVFGKRSATTGMFQGVIERNDLWWWKEDTTKYVSHWMPLPEPPKEDDDETD